MSLKYRDVTGKETPIAGLNGLSGELVPSVSYYQSGTATLNIYSNTYAEGAVTLSSAMPDTDYVVVPNITNTYLARIVRIYDKTVNGFFIQAVQDGATSGTITIAYQAFKLMTDESRAVDEQAIATNTANIATLKDTLSVTNGNGTRNASYVSSTSFRANWYKYGRIVTLSLQITASAELAGTELLVTGLPAPITDLTFTGATSAGNANLNAVLTTAGALRPLYSWANGAAFMGTLTYISKE